VDHALAELLVVKSAHSRQESQQEAIAGLDLLWLDDAGGKPEAGI